MGVVIGGVVVVIVVVIVVVVVVIVIVVVFACVFGTNDFSHPGPTTQVYTDRLFIGSPEYTNHYWRAVVDYDYSPVLGWNVTGKFLYCVTIRWALCITEIS